MLAQQSRHVATFATHFLPTFPPSVHPISTLSPPTYRTACVCLSNLPRHQYRVRKRDRERVIAALVMLVLSTEHRNALCPLLITIMVFGRNSAWKHDTRLHLEGGIGTKEEGPGALCPPIRWGEWWRGRRRRPIEVRRHDLSWPPICRLPSTGARCDLLSGFGVLRLFANAGKSYNWIENTRGTHAAWRWFSVATVGI